MASTVDFNYDRYCDAHLHYTFSPVAGDQIDVAPNHIGEIQISVKQNRSAYMWLFLSQVLISLQLLEWTATGTILLVQPICANTSFTG